MVKVRFTVRIPSQMSISGISTDVIHSNIHRKIDQFFFDHASDVHLSDPAYDARSMEYVLSVILTYSEKNYTYVALRSGNYSKFKVTS